MGSIKLKAKVVKEKKVKYEAKPVLYARKCDACGKVFEMGEFCNERGARMTGTFDSCASDRDGRGLGNMFSADVCSFACAQKIFDGGWKQMKEYKPYVKEKTFLARASLNVTSTLFTEEDLIKQWDDIKADTPTNGDMVSHTFVPSYMLDDMNGRNTQWGMDENSIEGILENALRCCGGDKPTLFKKFNHWLRQRYLADGDA